MTSLKWYIFLIHNTYVLHVLVLHASAVHIISNHFFPSLIFNWMNSLCLWDSLALIMRSERAGVSVGVNSVLVQPCSRSISQQDVGMSTSDRAYGHKRSFLSVRFTGLTSALGAFLNMFTACLGLTLIPPHTHTPISPNHQTCNQRHSWKHFLKNCTHLLHKK